MFEHSKPRPILCQHRRPTEFEVFAWQSTRMQCHAWKSDLIMHLVTVHMRTRTYAREHTHMRVHTCAVPTTAHAHSPMRFSLCDAADDGDEYGDALLEEAKQLVHVLKCASVSFSISRTLPGCLSGHAYTVCHAVCAMRVCGSVDCET